MAPGADQAAPSADEAGAEPAPVPGGQAAATQQAATSSAAATQQEPTNIVISVRIDSPGDDGPITQTNVAADVSDGSNASSTSQSAPDGGLAQGQDAASGQTASSTATAAQDQPRNVVVIVRINSPGNDGPISQTNASVAGSSASNTSAISQGVPSRPTVGTGAGGADGNGSSRDGTTAVGPPAEQQSAPAAAQPPASQPAASQPPSTSRLVALPAPVPPRSAATGPARSLPAAQGSAKARAEGKATRPATTTARVAGGKRVVPAIPSLPVRPAARHTKPAPARRPVRTHAAERSTGRDRSIPGRLGNVFGSFAPRRALPAPESSDDVSGVVLMTLIAVLGAALVFAASTYLPFRGRLLDPRRWWHT
jgi:hypothetical protein